MIRDALQKRKDQNTPAILQDEQWISYSQLAGQAAQIQALFPKENETKNRRPIAVIFLNDGADFLAALFAVLQAGWTAFPINHRLSADELSDLLRQMPVTLIITSSQLRPLCDAAASYCQTEPAVLTADHLPALSHPAPEVESPPPDTPMLLLSSSGTTGRIKLVQLSENNVAFTVRAYIKHMGYEKFQDPDPRYALGTPLFGIYGLLVTFSCILQGFPMIPMAENFTLNTFYQAVQKHKISHYDGGTLVAILMERTLGRTIPYDLSALRYLGFGGSKAPWGTLKRLSRAFPEVRFWSGYGMTEASPLIAQPYQGLPPDKLDSVGIPLPGVKVMIETEKGRTDQPNQSGEIVAQGPNIMLGYYENKKATEEILLEGWLHTGDIGYFDNDGYLYICGRKKNMILVRGFNVYPEEVETRLLSCPLIKDCFVYSKVPEPGSEIEIVFADIVPSGPDVAPEMIQDWCSGHLADYKCPKIINLKESLKKTSTGKNQRIKKE